MYTFLGPDKRKKKKIFHKFRSISYNSTCFTYTFKIRQGQPIGTFLLILLVKTVVDTGSLASVGTEFHISVFQQQ